MNDYSFLEDKRFLQQLFSLRIKQQFIKITVLNWKEEPLEQIQGVAISGSVNLDGSSSMRRTATLSLFAEEKDNNLANIDHLFAINKKCIIQLGIINTVSPYTFTTFDEKIEKNIFHTIDYQKLYGNIVWFPLGFYIMFNPSVSHGLNGVTINMQLKDKMCLLNGDIGGEIHSSIDFSKKDQVVDADSAAIVQKKALIYDIIIQLVNHWGNEPLHKIIISEVPLQIKQAVAWDGNQNIYLKSTSNGVKIQFAEITEDGEVIEPKDCFKVVQPGYDMGYIYTDYTYPGQLVCNAGDTITSVLDKIINVMGNYEYFYDVYGNFVFQEKQNYFNMTNTAYWTKQTEDGDTQKGKIENLPIDAYDIQKRLTKSVYDFSSNDFIVSYNNTFNYNNIKNDFVVWGAMKTTKGQTYPCRFHLAIDKKPVLGIHNIALYKDSFQTVRAVAYQPSRLNPKTNRLGIPAVGEILFPQADDEDAQGKVFATIEKRQSTDWREEIYYQMLESELRGVDQHTELNNSYFQYYAELKEEFPKIFDLNNSNAGALKIEKDEEGKITKEYVLSQQGEINRDPSRDWSNNSGNTKEDWQKTDLYKKYRETTSKAIGFKEEYQQHPEQIKYYLDFIEESAQLGQYSVNNIGRRAKIIDANNEGINCVFEPEIPDLVYIDATAYESSDEMIAYENQLTAYGQDFTQIDPSLSPLFKTGKPFNSCFNKIKDLLYQYTHMNNTISISSLPIYYLEPNTRISIQDPPGGIEGDYIIQSISLPLDINSTMSINAYKALERI